MKALLSILMLTAAVTAAAPPSLPVKIRVEIQRQDGSTESIQAIPQPIPATSPATTPVPTPTPPATAPVRPRPFLGINLEGLRDYGRGLEFIDAMKTSRRFGSATRPYDQSAPLDVAGNPTGDSGTYVITDVPDINGTYHFSALGKVTLGCQGGSISNLRFDGARTTADVTVSQPAGNKVTLALTFRGTAGGLKEIKLLRPGYIADETVFTVEFRAMVRQFSAIRFMDWQRTNNNPLGRTWADRPTPTDPQWTIKGAPLEACIALGNAAGRDVWLCIPAGADDDYIGRLGELVRSNLRAGLFCYIEYGNEMWNGGFSQAKENLAAAVADVGRGDKTLSDNGADPNQYHWSWRRIARKDVEIKKLLGSDPRFRIVLASQLGYAPDGTVLKVQLDYIRKFHGAPRQSLYAVAGAPYFSLGTDETAIPDAAGNHPRFSARLDLTVNQIIDRLSTRTLCGDYGGSQAFHALARADGLCSFAYEFGLDTADDPQHLDASLAAKVAAQYDPRIGPILQRQIQSYSDKGGDGGFYFNASGAYSKYGTWGLTEDARRLDTSKMKAAAAVAKTLATNP